MAHIVEFTVVGLAGGDKTYTKKLNRDINIFFGLNGSGKTSLLKILHSAMSNDASILANVSFRSAEVTIYSIDHDKTYTYSIERPTPPKNDDQTFFATGEFPAFFGEAYKATLVRATMASAPKWTIKPALQKEIVRWAHNYQPTSRLFVGGVAANQIGNARESSLTEEQLDQYFARSLAQAWGGYSSEINRQVRVAQEAGLANILRAVLSTKKIKSAEAKSDAEIAYRRVSDFLSRRKESVRVLGTLKEFDRRYQDDDQLRSVVNDIEVVEQEVERAVAPRTKLQQLIEKLFSGGKQIKFDERGIEIEVVGGGRIGLASLSTGEKHLLKIFIAALAVNKSSLIIDEPELSMHVDWQRVLVSSMLLLNPDLQLIVATHSPEIMAEMEDDKIFRL